VRATSGPRNPFCALPLDRLTPAIASGSITRVKALLLCCLICGCGACTTLENRRDLYRSPAEGYEEWHRQPPPTRKPAGPPSPGTPVNEAPTQQQTQGVITFPEESLPSGQ
jgi:hypothetical protein